MKLSRIGKGSPPILTTENEGTQKSTNDDADDDIPIIIHSQKHNKVGNSELHCMEKSSDDLL